MRQAAQKLFCSGREAAQRILSFDHLLVLVQLFLFGLGVFVIVGDLRYFLLFDHFRNDCYGVLPDLLHHVRTLFYLIFKVN